MTYKGKKSGIEEWREWNEKNIYEIKKRKKRMKTLATDFEFEGQYYW